MWQPDTFQVPRAVIVAELAGEIPVGTTMATVAFLLNQATTKEQASATVKSFRLPNDAAKIAWRFVATGKLVTPDGEILSETSTGFPSNPTSTPTQPSQPSSNGSEKPSGSAFSDDRISAVWKKNMPGEPSLTLEQLSDINRILEENGQTEAWLENVLIDIKATGKAKNPIAVMMWKMKNESPDKAQQNAERHRLHPPPVDTVIKGAMERARAEIAALPQEEATDKTVKRLSALKERMGGKSQ